MQREIETLLRQVHETDTLAVVTVAGGGASAIAWVQSVPGASRTLLKATVPYHPTTLKETAGYAPEQAVSEEVALVLADRAHMEGRRLAGTGVPVVGIACTAALATDRLRRGAHRCHVGVVGGGGAAHYSLELTKGLRTREEEEAVVSRLVVRALAEACGLTTNLDLVLAGKEQVQISRWESIAALGPFLDGAEPALTLPPIGEPYAGTPSSTGVLSGSFNPLHRGHRELVAAGARHLNGEVVYELPVVNADKAPLSPVQVLRRLSQFAGWATLVLTRTPIFAEKADLFPGRVFAVGVDTARRIVEPRFYGETEEGVRHALARMRAHGCRFLVAGRWDGDRFLTLADVAIPAGFEDLFETLPESVFRVDISSSAIRRGGRE